MVKILVRYWLRIRSMCVCYASGRLVDRATHQFKPDCDMRLNICMSKVVVNSCKNVRSSEMERKIHKEQNFRLWSASNFGTGWSEETKIFCRQFRVYFQAGCFCVCVCVETYSRQVDEREQCCRIAILLRLSVWKWLKFKCSKLDYL